MGATLQELVQNGLRKICIMQHLAESGQRLVGSHDHGPVLQVAIVDHPVEHVGGIRGVALIAELVGDQDVGVDVRIERLVQPALGGGVRERADQLVRRGEAGVEAILGWPGTRWPRPCASSLDLAGR
jgi:hypothetical protein